MGCGNSSANTAKDTTSSPSNSATKLKNVKFIYFDIRARGESIRVLLHYGGIQFEDERIEFSKWPELKPTMPYGQLPVIVIDGHMMAQSNAIARFIASNTGMYGSSNLESSKIDAIVDVCCDLFEPIPAAYVFEKDEEKKKDLAEKYWTETAPKLMGFLEQELVKNGGGDGYLVGKSMSWADIRFWDQYFLMLDKCEQPDELRDQYPKLTALYEKIQQDPKIKSWVEKRPQNSF